MHMETMLEAKEKRLENKAHHSPSDTESIDLHPLVKHERKNDFDMFGQGIKGLFEKSLNFFHDLAPNFDDTFNGLQKIKQKNKKENQKVHEEVKHMQHHEDHKDKVIENQDVPKPIRIE